jgi:hypothetical protein
MDTIHLKTVDPRSELLKSASQQSNHWDRYEAATPGQVPSGWPELSLYGL